MGLTSPGRELLRAEPAPRGRGGAAFGHKGRKARCAQPNLPPLLPGAPRNLARGGWDAALSTPQLPERTGFPHQLEAEEFELWGGGVVVTSVSTPLTSAAVIPAPPAAMLWRDSRGQNVSGILSGEPLV